MEDFLFSFFARSVLSFSKNSLSFSLACLALSPLPFLKALAEYAYEHSQDLTLFRTALAFTAVLLLVAIWRMAQLFYYWFKEMWNSDVILDLADILRSNRLKVYLCLLPLAIIVSFFVIPPFITTLGASEQLTTSAPLLLLAVFFGSWHLLGIKKEIQRILP
ncbi:MAG: hypothetical protein IPM93_17965 [Candidatus Obscuribacter sp.]|nr:hypothetical protein [Candidatus Obscuribacter sp.]